MGSCCCCGGPEADPNDPDVTAYIRTGRFLRYREGGPMMSFTGPPRYKPVYVREGRLYLDNNCCMCCIDNVGYPVRSITSVEIARWERIALPGRGYLGLVFLNPGVKIAGADGTLIVFSGEEGDVEVFVEQLRKTMEVYREKSPKLTEQNLDVKC